jgi:hypothetical protein
LSAKNTERFVCVDCGALAPLGEKHTDDTSSLLTLEHGWRIRRRIVDGVAVVEARCAPCNARFKRDRAAQAVTREPRSTPVARFVDFAHGPGSLVETSHFRSSWLGSSLRSLRTHRYFDAYERRLPAEFRAPILESLAGTWLPIEVAVAHYATVDALDIPPATIFEMGREVQDHAQSILAPLALRTAKGLGVTPWVLFGQFRKIWDRTFRGGDFAIDKIGPKEAELEIIAWTLAPSSYVRHGMRGVLEGMLGMFCEKVHVREVPLKCGKRSLGYRFSWV